jgi:tight adherence protein C
MQIALTAVMTLSTALVAAWLALLFSASEEDKVSGGYGKLVDNLFKIQEFRAKEDERLENLAQYSGIAAKVMGVLSGGSPAKKISKIERQNAGVQNGDLSSVPMMLLPGYAALRKFKGITYWKLYKELMVRHMELYGKKYAGYKSAMVMAEMLSYAALGVGLTLALGSMTLAAGLTQPGIGILSAGSGIVLLLAYSKYDEVRAKTVHRREAIARQFPGVVSKLALLVCSGMIMDKAWRETAASKDSELYQEMKKTSDELSQNIAPEAAYSAFISRCNTKETSKLASAILQNISKGNAEIGNLLRELAREAWQERRHSAKRDAEKANSKLIIPTMLLFLSILIMIMVPLAMSMQGA